MIFHCYLLLSINNVYTYIDEKPKYTVKCGEKS